jgi:nucleoside-diphosphate-sugar epimerase
MERLPSPGLFIRLGKGSGTVNVVPVDFVVEALARLSAADVSRGKTYHLTDPRPHGPVEIARMFAKGLGKRFAYVPVPLGLARAAFSPGPVRRFFGMPKEALDYFDDAVRHDATLATTDLRALGLECPSLDDYVPRLVDFYLRKRDEVRRDAMT